MVAEVQDSFKPKSIGLHTVACNHRNVVLFGSVLIHPAARSGTSQFGLFEFDAATRELRRESVRVRLQSQPAQVLACLIEHAGKVVSREELRRAVWGGETFVDFD